MAQKLRGFPAAQTYHWLMNNQDDQLHRLLQQWKEIEPASNFDAQVWRQIHEPAPVRRAAWLLDWLPRPAFALPAAVVLGLIIGIGSGLFSVPVTPHTEQLSFLAPDTLAGALRR
jgi:hypothetical protein